MADILQPWQIFLTALAGWINSHQQAAIDYLREENRVLHDRLRKRRLRLTDDERRRLAVAGKALGRKALKNLACLFSPDTILAWHRKLVAAKWDHHQNRRGPGRPGVMKEIERLVVRFAQESPTWGYRRIQGALANLGHCVARTTVANILKRHGIDPAPERRKYSEAFRAQLTSVGVESLRLPLRSPNLNAWIERFVRSIKEDCLDRMILFGEASLRRAIKEYLAHFHRERNHQGLDNRLIEPERHVGRVDGQIECRERLGGMLRYYYRDAA